MFNPKNNCTIIPIIPILTICSLFVFTSAVKAYRPSEQMLTIGGIYGQAPYFYGYLDAAGYSDVICWGYEPNHHPYSYHEVLSGEWGSFAIYYDGIATEPNSMFLTNEFLLTQINTDLHGFICVCLYASNGGVYC